MTCRTSAIGLAAVWPPRPRPWAWWLVWATLGERLGRGCRYIYRAVTLLGCVLSPLPEPCNPAPLAAAHKSHVNFCYSFFP